MSLCGSMLHKELADAILVHLPHYLVTGFFYGRYFIQPTEQLCHHPSETIPVAVTAVMSITSIFPWAGTAVAARTPESSVLSLCTHFCAHLTWSYRHTRAWSAAYRPGAGMFRECLVKGSLQPATLVV